MAGLTLERLKFDATDPTAGPLVGSYILSEGGEVITHSTDGAKERLDVSADIAGLSNPSEFGIFAEDAAHTSGDLGQFILAVRNDTQGSLVDTDLDYAPLQLDSAGRLRTITDIDLVGDLVGDDEADTEDPLKVGSHAYDSAAALGTLDAGDKANLASDLYRRLHVNEAPQVNLTSATQTIDTTLGGTELAAAPMAGRKWILIQNQGNDSVYIGPTGLTSANGVEIGKGDSMTMPLGEAVNIFAIAGSGSQDVRVMQWG